MASTSVVFDLIAHDRASDKFDRVGNSADRSSGKLSKLGGVAKTAAKTGVLAIAAGGIIAGKALFDMAQGAIEDEAAQKKLATALKLNAGATSDQISTVESWISAQGLATGVADDELRPALGRLVAATQDVTKAQELARLGMEVSAGSGASLETVTKALAKAQNGSVAGLAKFGISVKKANGETISFEQAQKRLGEAFRGQVEAKANTLSGKIARLKLALGEAGEEIGARLIPVITKMADWFLNKGLPALERFGAFLRDKIPPIFDKVQAIIAKFTGDGSGKFSKFIADVKAIFTDGVAIVQNLWRLFGDNILQYVRSTFNNIKSVLSGAFDIIRGIFKTVSALLKGDWGKAWDGIKLILRGAAKVIRGLVGQLFNVLRFAFKNAGVALKKIWSVAWDGIKQLAGKGKDWLVDKIKSIPGFIKGLAGRYVEAGRWIMSKLWEIIKDKARDGHQFLVEKIREIPGKIKDLGGKFLEAGGALVRKIFEGIRNAASGAGGLLGDVAGSFAESFKGVINNLIDSLNDKIPNEIEINNAPNINLPDNPIPHLARGTNNWRGGWAMVGEEGPELVNLPGGSRVLPHGRSVGALRAAGGGNVTINISGALDPVAVGRQVEQVLIKYTAATGRPLQVSTR